MVIYSLVDNIGVMKNTIYMLIRFVLYGLTGFLIEVLWTGFGSLISGNLALTGTTYLWMFFIYGLAVFLEPIHNRIRREHFLIRGFIYVLLIYVIEFSSGFILDTLIGYCPWDYTASTRYTFFGYIRLDYFPAWLFAGFLFERFHDFLDSRLQRPTFNE